MGRQKRHYRTSKLGTVFLAGRVPDYRVRWITKEGYTQIAVRHSKEEVERLINQLRMEQARNIEVV